MIMTSMGENEHLKRDALLAADPSGDSVHIIFECTIEFLICFPEA